MSEVERLRALIGGASMMTFSRTLSADEANLLAGCRARTEGDDE